MTVNGVIVQTNRAREELVQFSPSQGLALNLPVRPTVARTELPLFKERITIRHAWSEPSHLAFNRVVRDNIVHIRLILLSYSLHSSYGLGFHRYS